MICPSVTDGPPDTDRVTLTKYVASATLEKDARSKALAEDDKPEHCKQGDCAPGVCDPGEDSAESAAYKSVYRREYKSIAHHIKKFLETPAAESVALGDRLLTLQRIRDEKLLLREREGRGSVRTLHPDRWVEEREARKLQRKYDHWLTGASDRDEVDDEEEMPQPAVKQESIDQEPVAQESVEQQSDEQESVERQSVKEESIADVAALTITKKHEHGTKSKDVEKSTKEGPGEVVFVVSSGPCMELSYPREAEEYCLKKTRSALSRHFGHQEGIDRDRKPDVQWAWVAGKGFSARSLESKLEPLSEERKRVKIEGEDRGQERNVLLEKK